MCVCKITESVVRPKYQDLQLREPENWLVSEQRSLLIYSYKHNWNMTGVVDGWNSGLLDWADVTAGKQNRKRKEEEKWYFLIPPRESCSLLYPRWAGSSEGPSTAHGHLLHSMTRVRKKWKGERTDIKQLSRIIMMYTALHCTYLGSQQRTTSASVSPQWFQCSIVMSKVSMEKKE